MPVIWFVLRANAFVLTGKYFIIIFKVIADTHRYFMIRIFKLKIINVKLKVKPKCRSLRVGDVDLTILIPASSFIIQPKSFIDVSCLC
jgi:hypothetical protein